MTLRSLANAEPVLYGMLSMVVEGDGQPHLTIRVNCPYCPKPHLHGWVEKPTAVYDTVDHRVAHCWVEGSVLRSTGYWIALDPLNKAANRAVLKRYMKALAQFAGASVEPILP